MGCACGKNRARANGTPQVSGTYRVMVNGTQVYESANKTPAQAVADRFKDAKILAPGE